MQVRSILAGLLLLGFGGVQPVGAQSDSGVTIVGRVLDRETDDPLPGTHVFVSRSLVGTVTDSTGRFRLTDVPRGANRLYVSRLGYQNKAYDLYQPRAQSLTITIRLRPEVLEEDFITVEAERDEEWYEHLRRFTRLFIGESKRAEQCTLLNPEVLQFETSWWGKFEAQAEKPLIIENQALGYRVTYHLEEFEVRGPVVRWDGEPLFETLSPQDSAQLNRWKANRRDAYQGSLRHFLRALLNDRVEAAQFRMYRIPRSHTVRRMSRADRVPTTRDRILEPGPDSTHLFDVRGRLEVLFHGKPESEAYLEWGDLHRAPRDHQTSQIELNKHPIHIDPYGEIVEPYGATLHRYFAFTVRMAEILPREYHPPE